MKRKCGNFLAAFFVAIALGTVMAQTTYPIPYYCTEAGLRELCGDDWHACYAALGCWLIGAEPANAPTVALTQRNVRFR